MRQIIINISYVCEIPFQVAKTLAKIKGKDSIKDDVLPQDNRSLSQIEKDENSLSREELIEHNEAWSAVEKDELFVPEYTKFNSDHINKEATEGVALKMPIFFCVIKSMDLLSGHDINCELIDMKGNGFLPTLLFLHSYIKPNYSKKPNFFIIILTCHT
jgi:hypothetical protein